MAFINGTNIVSSLGFSAEENFCAVKHGITGIKHTDGKVFGLPEPFMASLIDKERLSDEFETQDVSTCKNSTNVKKTYLEKAAILSVFLANKEAKIDLASNRTVFIISTTKGNIDLLDLNYKQSKKSYDIDSRFSSHVYLWHTSEIIAKHFQNTNTPILVSNACISGAAAQIVAKRALQSGKYEHAVVVGVDFLSKFIVSGFQAFKALSSDLCKPFDKNRCGLNLGEAAATMIFSIDRKRKDESEEIHCALINGAVRNDATHISAPSRTGEGSFRALLYILNATTSDYLSHSLPLISQIAFINAHGTATQYNDAMEANAIVRAGLKGIPVVGLKSYFGHTLGAAGIVETIISIKALSEGIILKTLGFEENEPTIIKNEPLSLNICRETAITNKRLFIKMLSGFGGVNAALLFQV